MKQVVFEVAQDTVYKVILESVRGGEDLSLRGGDVVIEVEPYVSFGWCKFVILRPSCLPEKDRC